VKEAGKDTWKNRAKIWSATVTAVHRVNQFATALGRLRSRLRSKTRIEVGLPVPNGDDGTRLELEGSDVDELALQLALFVHHLPTLLDLMRKEKFDRSSVASGIQLKLLSDASLQVSWQDPYPNRCLVARQPGTPIHISVSKPYPARPFEPGAICPSYQRASVPATYAGRTSAPPMLHRTQPSDAAPAVSLAKLWPPRMHESNCLKTLLCLRAFHRWQRLDLSRLVPGKEVDFCRWCPAVRIDGSTFPD